MRATRLLCLFVCALLVLPTVSPVQAAPDRPSIAIKFAVDEPLSSGQSDESSEVEGPAGVRRPIAATSSIRSAPW